MASSMESHDYPIEHFRMMAEVTARLKSIPALILEHSYSYESFGSWWFAFRAIRLDGKPLPDVSFDSLISEVCALVSKMIRGTCLNEWRHLTKPCN
jgi:hypothetical protein